MEDELIYHYTTFEAFLSIVSSNSLWASDLEALNDPTELWNPRQLLYDALAVHRGRGAISYALPKIIGIRGLPSVWQFVGRSQDEYQRFAAGAVDYLEGGSAESHWGSAIGHVFGISFCKKPDLLSQWRAYGLNGSGVCVGFDRRKLAEALQPTYEIVDVIYDQKKQLQCELGLIRSAFERYQAEMKRFDPSFFADREITEGPDEQNVITITIPGWEVQKRSSEENKIIEGCLNDVLSSLGGIAHTFKISAFSEEQEVRLVSRIPAGGSQLALIKLRVHGNELIPYLEMKPATGTLPIQRVIFGPASKSFGQTYALKVHLANYGHGDVPIVPSSFALQ